MPPDDSKSFAPRPAEPVFLDEVGRGHGGTVYRGVFRDEACFIKVPPAALAETVHTRANFEREALQLARLQLAGMPRVLHLAAASERPYVVLSLPKGRVWGEWLRTKPSELTALEVASALCQGLCQLHALGYLHAQLEPEHVFVSEARAVQLLDQGSVHRQIPFDVTADVQGLAELLRRLAAVLREPEAQAAFTSIIDSCQSAARAPSDYLRALNARLALLQGRAPLATGLGLQLTARSTKQPPIVRRELAQLQQRFHTGALGPVTVVVAPEGAGKSRLLADFSESVRARGVHVLSVSCTNTECAPFSTIQCLLENHLRDLEASDPSTRSSYETLLRSAAGSFGPRLSLLSERLDSLFESRTPGLVQGDARAAFIDGLAAFLGRYLSALGRSVLILDDLQHLDASSRMVLARLATLVRAPNQLIVGAMKSADDDHPESLERFDAMLAPGVLSRVVLQPLLPSDAHEVAVEFLGAPELSYEAVVLPLAQLTDGTPLCLNNLLTFAIEQRLLLPQAGSWSLDVQPLTQTHLPASSRRMIAHRFAMLSPQTLHILQAAAVIGTRIDALLLARVASVELERARAALDQATSYVLMQRDDHGYYSFIHNCVCETLLRPVSELERRTLHQAVADALRSLPSLARADEFTLARHLALGVVERSPAETLATLKRAGLRAAYSYDDALTLLLLRAAERAAQVAQLPLDRAFHLCLAEASLRTGETRFSLRYFEAALTRSRRGVDAAHILGRIAWLHHFEGRSSACWNALSAALRELNEVVPSETPLSLLYRGLGHLRPRRRAAGPVQRRQLETLCELYVLSVRMSMESGNPLRAFSALWLLLRAAGGLPPCRAKVDAELLKSFVLSGLGKHAPFRGALNRAYAMAEAIADPFALAQCHQVHSVIAAWRGDLDEWARQADIWFDSHISYIELGELCHTALGLYAGHLVLGKPEQGYRWVERACARAQQIGHAPAMFALLEEAACAHLVGFERESEAEDLKRRLSHVQRAALQPGGYFYMLGFQFRVQRLVDSGRLGAELDALIDEWRSFGQRSSRVHPTVALYYLHVAHARMHQCLRALLPERRLLLQKLEEALGDLEPLRRAPVIAAHSDVVTACRDFLRGDYTAAEVALGRAEQQAREQHCIWVTYAATRLRAHMWKSRGQLPRAREQARIAAQLAREYGPPSRLRAICEEFELEEHTHSESPNIRQHLDALLHIAHASGRELSPRHQAQFVLNELLQTLHAERGFLFMSDSDNSALRRLAARGHDGQELTTELTAAERNLVEQVYASGRTALAAPALVGERQGVAVALVLRELVVGVIYLDRSSSAGAFNSEAVTLIEALANQVPVLLELAHALRERARLERNLREAQKMEAIGRLAGGIAHDFNNILGTIEFSASCLTENVLEDGSEDLADIREAAKRGAALTKQLTLIARGKQPPKERVDLTQTLSEVEPLLNVMLRGQVQLDLQLPPQALHALAEPSQIERLITNLCRNAADAMPDGGELTVRLSRADQSPLQLKAADDQPPHRYGFAELLVRDTGHGMSEKTRARIFEPFFTTKAESEGTGLGLAIVYAIVQQCEGDISVVSAPGRGTTFRVFIPLCDEPAAIEAPSDFPEAPSQLRSASFGTSVCVVDDDETYRTMLARALMRAGYSVLAANSGKEALHVIANATALPELIISDLNMPELNGMELVQKLRADQPGLKVLLISGSPHSEHAPAVAELGTRFLQKPFSAEVLLREVERVLGETAEGDTRVPLGDLFG
jgi:signal transduction histidine kinase/ActR/RegA family two-component response regulator/serine/threonine protein kinase